MHTISGSETLNARFPGQWFQVESGLHYNWHRHYDPTIGRYTQPDPLGFVDGPSVYAYARNAPGEVIDFTGLSPEVPGGPIVIDPRTGEQIYPPKPKPPTQPGIEPPQSRPPAPDFRKESICRRIFDRCLKSLLGRCTTPYTAGAAIAICTTVLIACRTVDPAD
ncbi:MAG: RHS repeat-associated core domain-containing protein [Hyphomicrobium sp.]